MLVYIATLRPNNNVQLHPSQIISSFQKGRMPPYYPPTTQACFHYNYLAHDRGILCSDDYLNRMLAHLSGVRHPEDKSTMTLSDPLSMVFYACTEQLDTVIIEGKNILKQGSNLSDDSMLTNW